MKNKKFNISYIFLIAFILYLFFTIIYFGMLLDTTIDVPYSEFKTYLNNNEVAAVFYDTTNEDMSFYLKESIGDVEYSDLKYINWHKVTPEYNTKYPAYDEFRKDALEAGVYIEIKQTMLGRFISIFNVCFPLLMLLLLFGIMRFSQSNMGLNPKDVIQTSDVTFDAIIGHEEIIDDIKFITELIKNPKKGEKIGAKLPKGLLFVGSPGTGKTLIAKAIAHEAGVPFLYMNASNFIEMYVGVGAKRVRALFKLARKQAPCILFIDEIDAIGGKRGEVKGTAENDQTINAILQEMDGFTSRDGVFIIAATNRPDVLDDALVRSGRFDRQITVNPPRDWHVRKALFKHYLSKFAVGDDVDIENLSKQTAGFTGADIAMICNEASIIAVMKDKDYIDNDCVEEAIDKKIFHGNRSKNGIFKDDKDIVAYHEAGHAVMSYLLNEPIARASIQSTISGVGGAVINQDRESVFHTDEDFINRVYIAYAGRASEIIKFNKATTGASNDITQATNILTQYIERFGFDEEFGLLDISVLTSHHLVDADKLTERLSSMSTKLFAECKELLEQNYNLVEILATKLLEVESLSGSEIEALFGDNMNYDEKYKSKN